MARPSKDWDKAELLTQLMQDMNDALGVMLAAAQSAHDAATHEEMKPENDKDTRGLEAGYLAAGQSARAAELQQALRGLQQMKPRAFAPDEAVSALAIVELEDQDNESCVWVFLTPYGSGQKLKVSGQEIQVATARSPLGDSLLGKRVGDLVEYRAGGRRREFEILSVQ